MLKAYENSMLFVKKNTYIYVNIYKIRKIRNITVLKTCLVDY